MKKNKEKSIETVELPQIDVFPNNDEIKENTYEEISFDELDNYPDVESNEISEEQKKLDLTDYEEISFDELDNYPDVESDKEFDDITEQIYNQFDENKESRELKADMTAAGAAGATALAEEGLKKYAPGISAGVEKVKGLPLSIPRKGVEVLQKYVSGLNKDQLNEIIENFDLYEEVGKGSKGGEGGALANVVHTELSEAIDETSKRSFKTYGDAQDLRRASDASLNKSDLIKILEGVAQEAGPDIKEHEKVVNEIKSVINDLSGEKKPTPQKGSSFQEFLPEETLELVEKDTKISADKLNQLIDSFDSKDVTLYDKGIGEKFKQRAKPFITKKLSQDAVDLLKENRQLMNTISVLQKQYKIGELEDGKTILERFSTDETTDVLRKYLTDPEFKMANPHVAKLYKIDEVYKRAAQDAGLKKAELAAFYDMMHTHRKTDLGQLATMAAVSREYAAAKGAALFFKQLGGHIADFTLAQQARYRKSNIFKPIVQTLNRTVSKAALPAAAALLSYHWAIENGLSEEQAAALGALEFIPIVNIVSGVGQTGVDIKKEIDNFYGQIDEVEQFKKDPDLYKAEIIANTVNERMKKAKEKETVSKQQAEADKQFSDLYNEVKQRDIPANAQPYMKLLEEYKTLKDPKKKAQKEFILRQQPYINNKLGDK